MLAHDGTGTDMIEELNLSPPESNFGLPHHRLFCAVCDANVLGTLLHTTFSFRTLLHLGPLDNIGKHFISKAI